MKFNLIKIAAYLAVLGTGAAFAQAPAAPAPSPLSFNLSLTSNYKYRGQDQHLTRTSSFKPALQGGFDYALPSGFYVGNWNSTVSFRDTANNKANLEIDLYGGYKFSAGDWGFDVGALTYIYPGAGKANTTEIYGATTYGPFTAKYSSTVSRGYFGVGEATGDGRGTGYLNLAFAKEVAPSLTFKASVGQTMFRSVINTPTNFNFTDYSVGASYDLGDGLSLTGALQGATKKDSFQYVVNGNTRSANRDTFILTITKAL